jgi:hypothetical protein
MLTGNSGMQVALELIILIRRILFRPLKVAKVIATTGAINGQCITGCASGRKRFRRVDRRML